MKQIKLFVFFLTFFLTFFSNLVSWIHVSYSFYYQINVTIIIIHFVFSLFHFIDEKNH